MSILIDFGGLSFIIFYYYTFRLFVLYLYPLIGFYLRVVDIQALFNLNITKESLGITLKK